MVKARLHASFFKQAYRQVHTHTHSHAHTHARTRTHTRTHTRTRKYTHIVQLVPTLSHRLLLFIYNQRQINAMLFKLLTSPRRIDCNNVCRQSATLYQLTFVKGAFDVVFLLRKL